MKGLFEKFRKACKEFDEDNAGVGIVEVILILVVNYSRLKKYILCF